MSESTQPFVDSVKRAKKARKMSQAELAGKVALSHGPISRIESGRLDPSLSTALAIARALGTTVEELSHDN